jgi:23S rRNA pseudouridine1911/1915/1917 synthase
MKGDIELVGEANTRLDKLLALRVGKYSRSHLQDLIERGLVTVDGKKEAPSKKLKGGERIVVSGAKAEWPELAAFESWVIHEDAAVIVLNKPAGLLMHPLGESWLASPEAALAEPDANLAGVLQRARPEILKKGTPRCGIVHRLDRQTSGVLLVAKTPAAYEALVSDFKDRLVQKLYRAVVRGVPADKAARVEAPIGRDPGHRKVKVTPYGKLAETQLKVVGTAKGAALVEARPLTGRTHQIRAHLALTGNPVMGDAEFDKKKEGQPWPPRLLLHAYRVAFEHPKTGQVVEFSCEPPADFTKFWRSLKSR